MNGIKIEIFFPPPAIIMPWNDSKSIGLFDDSRSNEICVFGNGNLRSVYRYYWFRKNCDDLFCFIIKKKKINIKHKSLTILKHIMNTKTFEKNIEKIAKSIWNAKPNSEWKCTKIKVFPIFTEIRLSLQFFKFCGFCCFVDLISKRALNKLLQFGWMLNCIVIRILLFCY